MSATYDYTGRVGRQVFARNGGGCVRRYRPPACTGIVVNSVLYARTCVRLIILAACCRSTSVPPGSVQTATARHCVCRETDLISILLPATRACVSVPVHRRSPFMTWYRRCNRTQLFFSSARSESREAMCVDSAVTAGELTRKVPCARQFEQLSVRSTVAMYVLYLCRAHRRVHFIFLSATFRTYELLLANDVLRIPPTMVDEASSLRPPFDVLRGLAPLRRTAGAVQAPSPGTTRRCEHAGN